MSDSIEQDAQAYKKIKPETLQEFCDRYGLPLSWGYRYSRMRGENRLPHIKAGKYIRIIPQQADEWMLKKMAG